MRTEAAKAIFFWTLVKRTPTCWLWQAGKIPSGYGMFYYQRRQQGAHRVAWQLARGAIPKGKSVLHKCDNPTCVNPRHLFLGTPAQNTADMMAKGRHRAPTSGAEKRRGENNGSAKLTKAAVAAIRKARANGCTLQVLADRHRVSVTAIWFVVTNQNWRE